MSRTLVKARMSTGGKASSKQKIKNKPQPQSPMSSLSEGVQRQLTFAEGDKENVQGPKKVPKSGKSSRSKRKHGQQILPVIPRAPIRTRTSRKRRKLPCADETLTDEPISDNNSTSADALCEVTLAERSSDEPSDSHDESGTEDTESEGSQRPSSKLSPDLSPIPNADIRPRPAEALMPSPSRAQPASNSARAGSSSHWDGLQALRLKFLSRKQPFPNTTPELGAELVEYFESVREPEFEDLMKSALSRYRGPLLQSREEVQEVMASFMDRHSAPITTKRPREVSPTGDSGSGALGCKIDPSQVLRAMQELHKACSKMQTKYSESMGLEAYEQWVEELLGLIQLYMGDDWRRYEIKIVRHVPKALNKEVAKLWQGLKQSDATWEEFLEWTRKQLALNAQSEAELTATELFSRQINQNDASIQKHNLAFNRKMQKLVGEAALPECHKVILYRLTLDAEYAKISYFDQTGAQFRSLTELQTYLLKHESALNKQKRDSSLLEKIARIGFRGKKRWGKGKRPLSQTLTDSPPDSLAAMKVGAPSDKQSRQRTDKFPRAGSFLPGEEDRPCHQNDLISNMQAKWLVENKRCVFCTGPRSECCPTREARCMKRRAVDNTKPSLVACPAWRDRPSRD